MSPAPPAPPAPPSHYSGVIHHMGTLQSLPSHKKTLWQHGKSLFYALLLFSVFLSVVLVVVFTFMHPKEAKERL
eukprot:m.190168 g.190168  ORF g.190168 m.190168 type:complete len:74 (+) comp39430_c0_seq49:841-1062(+)